MRWWSYGVAAALGAALAARADAAAATGASRSRGCRATVEECSEGTVRPGELTSAQVKDLQRTLHDAGYGVRATGSLDDQTRRAVSRFQHARALSATGELDGPTAHDLGVDRRSLELERGEHGT